MPELSIKESSLKKYLKETYNITIQDSMKDKLKETIKEEIKSILKEFHTKPIEKWYDNDPEELMSQIYWSKSQIPPSDPTKWTVQWQSIARQLNQKFPVPNNKRYLLTFKMGDKVK